MDICSVALAGMERAAARVERSAARLATAADVSAPSDGLDLSQEVVSLLAARNDFAVQSRVVLTADEMQRQVLDLLA
jgi:hypothetical protein